METNVVSEIDDLGELRELYQTHWWFEDRSLAEIRESVANSDEFVGLRSAENGELVASARIITDYVYTGKILDVIVAGSLRRQGVGTRLMGAITNHPRLRETNELTLNCREGIAPFYETCGFRVHELIEERQSGAGEDYYVMVYS